MLHSMIEQPWFFWGMLVLFGMPIAFIVLGEIIQGMQRTNSSFLPIAQNIRNILIPVSVAYLLIANVLELEESWLPLKIIKTLFWIILIHSSLKFVNALVFSEVIPAAQRNKIPKLLVDFARTFMVLLGGAFVMSNVWGADLGGLLAALGVGSVVLGLALQDVLGGLFAGIALLSSRPFVVGDWIQIGDDIQGEVVAVDWRAVSLVNHKEDLIVIPNAAIAKEQFYNFSKPSRIHMEIVPFDISFDDPPSKVKKVLLEVTHQVPGILKEPSASVALVSYDEFSIRYEVRYFIDDFGNRLVIHNDYISRVWYANRRHGVKFPTRAHEVYHFGGDSADSNQLSSAEIANEIKVLGVLDIPIHQIDKLSEHSQFKEYSRGECILKAGSLPSRFYIILNGAAQEQPAENVFFLENISTQTLTRGDFFGISGMINKEPSTTGVFAQTDISTVEIEINAMRNMLQANPQVAMCLDSIVESRERNR